MSAAMETTDSILQQLTAAKEAAVVAFARSLSGYVADGDPVWLTQVTVAPYHNKIDDLGRIAAEANWPWSVTSQRIAEFGARLFLAHPSQVWPNFHALFGGVMRAVIDREELTDSAAAEWFLGRVRELGFGAGALISAINCGRYGGAFRAWRPRENRTTPRPSVSVWEKCVIELPEAELLAAIGQGRQGSLLVALAAERPEVVRAWIAGQGASRLGWMVLHELVSGSSEFDSLALDFVVSNASPTERASVLNCLMTQRPDQHRALFLSVARDPAMAANSDALGLLLRLTPNDALVVMPAIFSKGFSMTMGSVRGTEYREAFALAVSRLSSEGEAVFTAICAGPDQEAKILAMEALLSQSDAGDDAVALWSRRLIGSIQTTDAKRLGYQLMAKHRAGLFQDEWKELLGSPSKQLREIAMEGWKKGDAQAGLEVARQCLDAKGGNQRIGAAAYLAQAGAASDVALLQAAFLREKTKAVRIELREALVLLGAAVPDALANPDSESNEEKNFAALEKLLANQKRAPKAPAATWLKAESLPRLTASDASVVGPLALAYTLGLQAAQKEITVAPEVAPWLAKLDRARCGDFALALLDAWLLSPQEAKDRWVLALAGALGDTRILSVLNSWIPKWCEASRGKLAEYAAQAIALQGSDEAFMLLDALATRYRSKQRNIGAAAAQAFQAAAAARGLSADELGDVVVPAFGFDADGVRDFSWEGGAARAELGVGLKLSWCDPETDKALKGLPAAAPDALKTEVKELGKLLREAAKGQAARLELALVRQRRWPVARWRELYETHPVLRAYATRLVWGVYGGDGALRRCFRRYPNGLLADAAGGLEELPEADANIGMVHPLELSAEAVAAWRAHLARFKVEPPFPQLERPVERLDPLHANRRELVVAKDRALGAGTFRSRAERRGWSRGSVVDAGGVAGYFKALPGAGVEVSLEIEGLYIGVDPMETITLGAARFVRADSVKRGSYTYDDPQAGDERVLAFGEVPPVVYSETVGDLKAIAGIVADVEGGDA